MTHQEKINAILKHRHGVTQYTENLGLKLIDRGLVDIGHRLIMNGLVHDQSKFTPFEFDHLWPDDPLLEEARIHHARSNPHHPEYWGGKIAYMPPEYLAEFSCDVSARATEFGQSPSDWIENEATKKYDFEINSKVHKNICFYLDLLFDKPFKPIKKKK
jgi:hypothetical protein